MTIDNRILPAERMDEISAEITARVNALSRAALAHRERHIRDALINLGWTPPPPVTPDSLADLVDDSPWWMKRRRP